MYYVLHVTLVLEKYNQIPLYQLIEYNYCSLNIKIILLKLDKKKNSFVKCF